MYLYSAYNLCFQSDIEMPGLLPGSGDPDVQILLKKLDDSELDRTPSWGMRVWGRIYHELQFLVEGGHTIVVDNRGGISLEMVRAYVQGVLMATLLRQRGYLVLHACGVAWGGGAIGFVGDSGWGKSTLAEYFSQNGFELINDDVMAIQVEEQGRAYAIPGFPQIRLRKDAGAWLREDFEQLPQFVREEKRLSTVKNASDKPVRLDRLYLLEPEYTSGNTLVPLTKREATMALIGHTRVTNLINDQPYRAAHLTQCATLVKSVPVALLRRTHGLTALRVIYDLICADVMTPSGQEVASS